MEPSSLKMPKQNRVTPLGEIIATAARGTLMGNRGILHDEEQRIVRPYKNKAWIICRLKFKGRKRAIMSPGRYTELFFLDEATALAAGHRPCFECQRERALAYRKAWAAANLELADGPEPRIGRIDAVLHAERLSEARHLKDKRKRTYEAALDGLPNGTFITRENKPFPVWDWSLLPWTQTGYETPRSRPEGLRVRVLTPRSTVGALKQGYVPSVHESAMFLLR
jgi:hypothetical protein